MTRAASPTPERCARCGKLALSGPTIAIPVAEYEALLRARDEAGPPRPPNYRAFSNSRIARDPELAGFILESAPTSFARAIETAAVVRFGRDRVPSHWAIHRFIRDAREAGIR